MNKLYKINFEINVYIYFYNATEKIIYHFC